jgi:hypothetical protein
MVGRHPKPHSRMEDDHKRTQGMEGQLPRAGLMAPSLSNGRGMTTGTGGGCTVLSTPQILLQVGHGILHLVSLLCRGSALLSDLTLGLSDFSGLILRALWPPGSVMPRERGKPRRGPSWYCYVARQRHLHELEKASSIARKQQIKKSMTPPMAYVEEEFPEEPIQVPPEFLLYTVPDSQDRPNTNIATMDTTTTMEGATCIVQEEIPPKDRPTGPPLPNPDMVCDQSPPSLFTLEHLELIFEMRSYMMEQLHRHTLISSRLDMLFDAFSNAPVKQRCPTCATLCTHT